jgi:hypothetical protein
MEIRRLEKDEYENYAIYEIIDSSLIEPTYYMAVNKDTKLVNIYSLDEKGKPNKIDLTNLKYKTALPTKYDPQNGVLIFNDPDKLDEFLVDLLGEYAPIITSDLKLQIDQATKERMELELSNPKNKNPENNGFDEYSGDQYKGLDPDVIDVLNDVTGEESNEMGGEGIDSRGGGGEEFPVPEEGEEIPPEEEEIPPEEEEK